MDCVFCKIVNKEAPADIVAETDEFIAFPDMNPKARVHILVIPKTHIPSLQDVKEHDTEFMGKFVLQAKMVAWEKGLAGYKLEMHVGKEGGQVVDHMHIHVLGN
jgi:histidine triad (HIT) family protein